MPFTLAHPAAVLAFKKSNWFSITALVAGSIVPDFEFFFQMREVENIGHHWYGIVLFDFPVGLLFCFLFHNLLRNTLVANLPPIYCSRFSHTLLFNWNQFARNHKVNVAVSLLIGIISHFFLDGFTHNDGVFVTLFPALLVQSGIAGMPVYFLLQVLLSVAGMMVVVIAIHKMPRLTNCCAGKNKFYWPLFLLVLAAILAIRIIFWSEYNSFWGVFMAVIGAICYSWLIVSLVFNKNIKTKLP